jgi:hypothetical protein
MLRLEMPASKISLGDVPKLEKTPTLLEKVTLNPQPLPPKTANPAVSGFSAYWGALNPQPLPPKQVVGAFADPAASMGTRGIIIIGGKTAIR